MKQLARAVLVTSVLQLCSSGCSNAWERATVTISYASPPASDEQVLQRFNRMRVEEVFRRVSKQYGYECKPHIKRVDEIRCRGPSDLHLVFQPSLNKPEFVARFSWVDVGGRTHEEFTSHVLRFGRGFSSMVGEQRVRIAPET
jgi:hypothetical protein